MHRDRQIWITELGNYSQFSGGYRKISDKFILNEYRWVSLTKKLLCNNFSCILQVVHAFQINLYYDINTYLKNNDDECKIMRLHCLTLSFNFEFIIEIYLNISVQISELPH